ncbi:MAG: HDIG domain-containing protein [Chloroflexota bacterium]|nr:HDIG domain-containing protein [Chloroflexota bacterium]
MEPTREQVLELLKDTVKNDSLRRHLLAVEACMRAYARHYGEDEARWAIAGLLHDFDWDICPTPQSHPQFGADLLRQRGYPEDLVRAVLSHGDHTGIPRETRMEVALFAVDEMSGFVTAVALVRPSKSLSETEPRSVRKKMKDKGFAAKVSRDDLTKGAQELGVDFDEHIARVIAALKPVASELGLNA